MGRLLGPEEDGLRWPLRELQVFHPCRVGDIVGYREGIWGFSAFLPHRWTEEGWMGEQSWRRGWWQLHSLAPSLL